MRRATEDNDLGDTDDLMTETFGMGGASDAREREGGSAIVPGIVHITLRAIVVKVVMVVWRRFSWQ
eukprot:6196870-Pleurochrysis_carterae.AAC.1